MHFGLGARDGRLIMFATHAGDIPVTPDNSNNLISRGGVELTSNKLINFGKVDHLWLSH